MLGIVTLDMMIIDIIYIKRSVCAKRSNDSTKVRT